MALLRRAFELLLAVYVVLAIVVVTVLTFLPTAWTAHILAKNIDEPLNESSNHSRSLQDIGSLSVLDEPIVWPAYPYMASNNLPSGGSTSIRTLFSKAFSVALQPNAITPFYYKSSFSQMYQANERKGHINKLDIAITTLVTQDRFAVLAQLAERYRGPISATIHVPVPSDIPEKNSTVEHALAELHRLYTSVPYLAAYVDIHLVLSPAAHSREFNLWRNIARYFAITPFVIMLDVDFVVCTDFRSRVLLAMQESGDSAGKDGPTMLQRLQEGRAALVIPAFEYTNHEEGKRVEAFPRSKRVCVPVLCFIHITTHPYHSTLSPFARSLFDSHVKAK
jgi:hypothetical protein